MRSFILLIVLCFLVTGCERKDIYNIMNQERIKGPVALLSNLPGNPTTSTNASIVVGGANITAYSYQLDGGAWSAETPVATSIVLSGLTLGTHTLNVIGKNTSNEWQETVNATTYTWQIIIGSGANWNEVNWNEFNWN